jgi:hypothetical protein
MRSVLVPLVALALATAGLAQAVAQDDREELSPARSTSAVDDNLSTKIFLPRREQTVREVLDMLARHAKVEVVVDPAVNLEKHVRLGSGELTGWDVVRRMEKLRGVGGDSFYGVLYVTCRNSPLWAPPSGPLRDEDASRRVTLAFDAVPVRDAIAALGSLSGIPFEIAEPCSQTVTLHLRRRPLGDAMAIFCRVAREGLERKGKRYVFSEWKSDDAITFAAHNKRAWTNYFLDECRVSLDARSTKLTEVLEQMQHLVMESTRDENGKPALVEYVLDDRVDGSSPVSIRGNDMRLRDALTEVLLQVGAGFDVRDGTVIIRPRTG